MKNVYRNMWEITYFYLCNKSVLNEYDDGL